MSQIDEPPSSALMGSFAAEIMFPPLKENEGYVVPGEVMHSKQKHETRAA